MAYPLPKEIRFYALEYLPAELLNYESGVNDSMTNDQLNFILTRTLPEKLKQFGIDITNVFDNRGSAFLEWQFHQRLSQGRLENFRSYQNNLIASRSGGLTDQFSGFIDRTNAIEIGVGAVLVATGAAAIGSTSIGVSAATLPTVSTASLPTLGQVGAAITAAASDEIKSTVEKEIKNLLEPKKIPTISENEVMLEQNVNSSSRVPLFAGLGILAVLLFI